MEKVLLLPKRSGKLIFGLDCMSNHSFQANKARMMLSLLAYNLTNWLRTLCFSEGQRQNQTIRTCIIKVASKLVKSRRSFYFNWLQVLSMHLSSAKCYEMFQVLQLE